MQTHTFIHLSSCGLAVAYNLALFQHAHSSTDVNWELYLYRWIVQDCTLGCNYWCPKPNCWCMIIYNIAVMSMQFNNVSFTEKIWSTLSRIQTTLFQPSPLFTVSCSLFSLSCHCNDLCVNYTSGCKTVALYVLVWWWSIQWHDVTWASRRLKSPADCWTVCLDVPLKLSKLHVSGSLWWESTGKNSLRKDR